MSNHARRFVGPDGRASLLARLAEWRTTPRYPLDWNEHFRWYLIVGCLEVGLIVGGLGGVVGLNESSRLGGVVALTAGLVLAVLIVVHLRRPTKPRRPGTTLRQDWVELWSALRKR
ncbi:hypothetical protein GCM10028777_02300 [Angustibacter speluncae]